MQENIEKLIAHYECEIMKENSQNNNLEKIKLLENVVNDLKRIVENKNEKNLSKQKNKKTKQQKHYAKKQEFIKSSIEPELVPRKIKKEY